MAGGVIQRIISLKDQYTPTLKNIQKGTLQYKKDLSELKSAGAATFKSLKVGMVATGVAVGAAALGISKVLKDSRAEAYAGIAQETKLATVMRQRMKATDDTIKSVKDLALAQEDIGVVGWIEQTSGAQELGTYLEEASSLKTLIPTMNNLVAQQYGVGASAEQVAGVATMLGKVMDGQLGALSRYGFTFDEAQEKILKYGSEAQRAALLVDIVKDSIGDMNEELGKTPEGKALRLKNMIAGIKDEIGRGIAIPIETFGVDWLLQAIPKVKQFAVDTFDAIKQAIADNQEKFDAIKSVFIEIKTGIASAFGTEGGGGILAWFVDTAIPAVVGGAASILEVVAGVYHFFSDNWTDIEPILWGIVGALTAYHLITKSIIIAKGIWTAAQWLLNAAMNANPIGLIIMGISALIGIGVYLVKNWDKVKIAGAVLWNSIVSGVEWMVNKVIDGINFMVEMALAPINKVIEGLNLIPGITVSTIDFKINKVDWSGAQLAIPESDNTPIQEDVTSPTFNSGYSPPTVTSNTTAMTDLTGALDENTSTMKSTKGKVNDINVTLYASDLTAEEIAQKLVPKLKRELFGS